MICRSILEPPGQTYPLIPLYNVQYVLSLDYLDFFLIVYIFYDTLLPIVFIENILGPPKLRFIRHKGYV